MNAYLAVDIGASSGRLIAGYIQDGKLYTKELHRFTNSLVEIDNKLTWDLNNLYNQIIIGLKKVKDTDLTPISLSIDTWGVDYVLIDDEGQLCDVPYGYRDSRTNNIVDEFHKDIIDDYTLYQQSGIQKLNFNTVYQLYAHKKQNAKAFDKAKHFLMIPDYLNFLLTGKVANEYTNASTTALIDLNTKNWNYNLIEKLGIPTYIFNDVKVPGTILSTLKTQIVEEIGFDLQVIMCASHDTASAVLATPLFNSNHIYLSSGTWSLMGIETEQANNSKDSYALNFTNEGGYNYRYRYLKNIMGLWILQNLRKELDANVNFDEVYAMAQRGSSFTQIIDINAQDFLAPKKMSQAFIDYCKNNQLPIPKNMDEIIFCAYNSLAHCYLNIIEQIEKIQGVNFKALNIVGGGCQDKFLNNLIAKITNKEIYAGPIEATAIGNICCQIISLKDIQNLEEARKLIVTSFDVKQINK